MPLNRRLALGLVGLLIASYASAADDPPKLAGTWSWKWKDAQGETHRHTLEVEGAGNKMTARERYDDEAAIKADDLKLDGKTITFSVRRNGRLSAYKGTVASAETINGHVTVTIDGMESEYGWTASREAGGK